MATTHDLTTRNSIAALVTGNLETGNAYAAPRLLIYGPANTLLASFLMGFPAFQVPVGGLSQANPIANVIGLANGTPERYEITDKAGTASIFGTIGSPGSGVDLEGSGNIEVGRTAQVTNLVYQAPP
jgi:hypothetical protein